MEEIKKNPVIANFITGANKGDNESCLFDNEDIKRKKNLEEFYKPRPTLKEPKDIRKYLVATDKIIDKEL